MPEELHGLQRREIDKPGVGKARETSVVVGEIAENDDQDRLAVVLGEINLALAFLAVEAVAGSEQDDRLAIRVGMAAG